MLTEDMIAGAAAAFGVSAAMLAGRDKRRKTVRARWAVMLLMRRKGRSFEEIGQKLGKDHTTVCHGVHQAVAIAKDDEDYLAQIMHAERLAKRAAAMREREFGATNLLRDWLFVNSAGRRAA